MHYLAPTDTITVLDNVTGHRREVELHEVLEFSREETIVQTRVTTMNPDGSDTVIHLDDNTWTTELTWYLTTRNGQEKFMIDDKDIEENLEHLAYDNL